MYIYIYVYIWIYIHLYIYVWPKLEVLFQRKENKLKDNYVNQEYDFTQNLRKDIQ